MLSKQILTANFDKLNLNDLVKLADSNIQLRSLIEKRFIISKYAVERSLVKLQIHTDHYTLNIDDLPESKIDQFDVILQFFQHFGSHVKKLQVDLVRVRKNSPQFHQLGQFIAQYSSDALESIQLIGNPHRWITNWALPLDKVQSVKLSLNSHETVSMVNELFPNIEMLDILVGTALSQEDNYHFPNLTHLIYQDELTLPNNIMLMYFIQANPQIRKLNGRNYLNPLNVQFISQSLPNLESLQFKTSLERYSGIFPQTMIPFANLKELSLELIPSGRSILFPILIGDLESLHLYHTRYTPAAAVFILSNRFLQRLSIPVMPISNENLNWFVSQLPELIELTILWDETILTADQIWNVMNRDSYLRRFTLMVRQDKSQHIEHLLQAVTSSWTNCITYDESYDMHQIQFQRTGEYDERKATRSGFA